MSLPASPPERTVLSWSAAHELDAVLDEAISGRGRVTRMLLKTAEARVVAVGMAKGVVWPEHKASGRVLIQVERGCISVSTKDGSSDFAAGTLIALEPQQPHDVRGIEDSAFLLIVCG